MHRISARLAVSLLVAFALFGISVGAGTAQEAVAPHPSHVHAGTCADLDPNPAYPLNDVTPVSPEARPGDVEVGHSTIDVTLEALLASPYALNVHASAEDVATYIACGDIAGPVVDGLLLIPLREQNDSGYAGIAALAGNDAGGTNVSVYLAPGLFAGADGAAAATPVADESAAPAQDEAAAPAEVAVTIADFAFSPNVLEIPAGTTVTWTNNDAAPHTATSTDGVWDSAILNTGDSFSVTFDEPGTFDYICSLHPNMTAQIVVTAP